MMHQLPQSSVLVSTVCLVLVIISAGNFKVSAAAQQYRVNSLDKCPNTEEEENKAKSAIFQQLRPKLENIPTAKPPRDITTTTTTETIITTTTTMEPPYNCNGTPGWRRIVLTDMTNSGHNCPSGLNTISHPKRTCGRSFSNRFDCSSTRFSIPGGSAYNQVCGRIKGYQVGSTSAFWGYHIRGQSLDSWYVDGVSLTHGPVGRRQHIWTFAAGIIEVESTDREFQLAKCPCDTINENIVATFPPFVGDDYFCETAIHAPWLDQYQGVFFANDPLWDGMNCRSVQCCQLNNPPWFTKTLPRSTTDDIELRVCLTGFKNEDDVAIELIELYVK